MQGSLLRGRNDSFEDARINVPTHSTDGRCTALEVSDAGSFSDVTQRTQYQRGTFSSRHFKIQAEARMAMFEWRNGWYNPHRLRSSLGLSSPITSTGSTLTM